jgi:HEPN domain-containing protein
MMRNPDQVIWDFVQGWLQKAEGDLRAAESLLGLKQPDYFTSAFHAQQAPEKFLKALLARHQIYFPKTHNIQQLVDPGVQADPALQTELASASILTSYGVEFRYPGDDTVDDELAKQSVEECVRVRDAVLARLDGYLRQGRPS